MKTLQEFITEDTQESINEATSRGKAELKVDLDSGEIQELNGFLVYKADGNMPNAEFDFKYNSSKDKKIQLTCKLSSGFFENKAYHNSFSKQIADIFEKFDDMEYIVYSARNSDWKKVEKTLQKLGIKVEVPA